MQGKETSRYKKINIKAFALIGAVALVALALCFFGVLGKYKQESYGVAEIQPERFVFVSNYEDNETYIYANGTTGTVVLELSNHEAGVVTKSDIEYQIEVTNGAGDSYMSHVSISQGMIEINGTITGGKLTGGTESSATITISDLVVGDTYEINITSITPYEKTLNYKFHVMPAVSYTDYYSVTAHDTWFQLDIYTGADEVEDITVTYPTTAAPDNTNEYMRNWSSEAQSGVLTGLVPNAHYTFIFFGDGTSLDRTEIEDNQINL